MKFLTILPALALAFALFGAAPAAQAATDTGSRLDAAVVAPGYWRVVQERVWQPGHYVRDACGYRVWVPGCFAVQTRRIWVATHGHVDRHAGHGHGHGYGHGRGHVIVQRGYRGVEIGARRGSVRNDRFGRDGRFGRRY